MRHVILEQAEGVGILTLDRPERFNSLDVDTARDFRKAGLQLARDRQVRVAIIRGSAGVFCSGADLKYIRAGGAPADLAYLQPEAATDQPGFGAVFKEILEYIHSTISEIRRAPKPFVAAVDGIAAAGGFGIAMACDLVFASERASFEWAYHKTGLTGAESSTFFLPRLIGLRRSMELVLLNPRLDARRAVELGLATAVYPTEGFDAAVMAVARQLADGPTNAFGVAKHLMNQAVGGERLDSHLDQELEHLARSADGSDVREGVESFVEKRPPQFRRS